MPTKEYYQNNKERCREQNRKDLAKHRKTHPQKRYPINAEKNRQNSARWLINNREKKKLYLKRWRSKNAKGKRKGRGKFCEVCKIDIPQILDIHHIVPRSLGGDDKPSNKITVCANCHRLIHAGLLRLLPQKGKLSERLI